MKQEKMKQERAYLIFDHKGRHYEIKTKYRWLTDAEREHLIKITKEVLDMEPTDGKEERKD